MNPFEDFLCERQDDICNAAFALFKALLPEAKREELEWDMSIIGPLVDTAGELLTQKGVPFCNPYYDGQETPCYMSPEKDCPLWDECSFRSCNSDPKEDEIAINDTTKIRSLNIVADGKDRYLTGILMNDYGKFQLVYCIKSSAHKPMSLIEIANIPETDECPITEETWSKVEHELAKYLETII